MPDLDTLRMLAGKASKGPWFYRPAKHDDWGTVRCSPDTEGYSPFVANVRSGSWTTQDEMATHRRNGTDPFGDNAQFIAACDPQTILALLDETERLRETNRKLHRRAQIAEAFMQECDDHPQAWLSVLKNRRPQENLIIRTLIDDIARAKKKAEARTAHPGEKSS